ncbi:hypothetical protein PFISCL1PPCAC_6547, partial [Pristionchus fissidentatus]
RCSFFLLCFSLHASARSNTLARPPVMYFVITGRRHRDSRGMEGVIPTIEVGVENEGEIEFLRREGRRWWSLLRQFSQSSTEMPLSFLIFFYFFPPLNSALFLAF